MFIEAFLSMMLVMLLIANEKQRWSHQAQMRLLRISMIAAMVDAQNNRNRIVRRGQWDWFFKKQALEDTWRRLKTLEDAWRCLKMLEDASSMWSTSIIHGIIKHHPWDQQASYMLQYHRLYCVINVSRLTSVMRLFKILLMIKLNYVISDLVNFRSC